VQRQQLEVGEDYAVVLAYPRFGSVDPRRIDTYVKHVGRCRLISKRSGKNGLVFALVDDFRRPESGALTSAGEEVATESARDVISSSA
jgi:hypothetical protein